MDYRFNATFANMAGKTANLATSRFIRYEDARSNMLVYLAYPTFNLLKLCVNGFEMKISKNDIILVNIIQR